MAGHPRWIMVGCAAAAVLVGTAGAVGRGGTDRHDGLQTVADGLTEDVFVGQGLTGHRQLFHVPGTALTVTRPGGRRTTVVSGSADLAAGLARKEGQIQPIGSNTKVVTAVLVMRLVEKGLLELEETVPQIAARNRGDGGELEALVAEFPDRLADVRLRELLNHTSGLFDCLDTDAFFRAFVRDPRRGASLGRLARFGLAQPPVFPPGAPGAWNYSNTDYMLLGMVLKAVTGRPLREQMNELFRRTGMNRTYYTPGVRALAKPPLSRRLAGGFMSIPVRPRILARAFEDAPVVADKPARLAAVRNVSTNPDETGPTVEVTRAGRKKTKRVRRHRRFRYRDVTNAYSLEWARTAGGIVSTSDDLARFYRALFGGRLVSSPTLREMEETVATGENSPGVETRWGLGFGEQRIAPNVLWKGSPPLTVWMHAGDLFGYASAAYYVEQPRLVVTNVVNLFPLPVGDLGLLRNVLRELDRSDLR